MFTNTMAAFSTGEAGSASVYADLISSLILAAPGGQPGFALTETVQSRELFQQALSKPDFAAAAATFNAVFLLNERTSHWLRANPAGFSASAPTDGAFLPHADFYDPAPQTVVFGREAPLVRDNGPLNAVLAELDSLQFEAEQDDLPALDEEAIANARDLLPKFYRILPVRYRVSPTERRGVAIDAPMRHGASVAVECAPDDTVYCFAAIDGNSRRAKFYQTDGLPDVFIEKALRDLAAG